MINVMLSERNNILPKKNFKLKLSHFLLKFLLGSSVIIEKKKGILLSKDLKRNLRVFERIYYAIYSYFDELRKHMNSFDTN